MLLALLLLAGTDTDPESIYNGRAGRLDVHPPRLEAELTVDGVLDEPAWGQAAMMTGFSQFTPVDGVAAHDSTEVLVWYSATAIHFGIRAYEAHGAVHATLADRDKIASDDYVQILLGTFDDGRQASVFAVNPFGVQSDGALVETGSTSGNGFNNAVVKRENADLSPDFVFDSKGRLTDFGYEVEVRIPFKSLRFQPAAEQRWGINVTRQVQHSGAEDSWAPAKRASASFLGQSGHLVGLTELRRGLVLEFNPSVTSKTIGGPGDRWLELRRRQTGARRQPALGRHQQPEPQRDRQPRLLAGRVRCRPVPVRSAERALLLREAAVLPRRHRAVRHAQPADLHPAHRPAGRGREAHRQGLRHRHRAALGRGRSRGVAQRPRPSRLQPAPAPARRRRAVAPRHGLHRPDRGERLQPRGRAGRAAPLR